MANTVEGVEGSGEGEGELDGRLCVGGKVGPCGEKVRRVDGGVHGVKAVYESSGVEDTSESDTGETVKTGEVPGDLGTVDREMGRVGTVQALSIQELEFLHLGHLLGLDVSARHEGCRRHAERRG